jgi:hypothetical protein
MNIKYNNGKSKIFYQRVHLLTKWAPSKGTGSLTIGDFKRKKKKKVVHCNW